MTGEIIDKPYTDYKFLGVRSFTELLAEAGREYSLVNDQALHDLYSLNNTFLNIKDDTVQLGLIQKDSGEVYFLEFGIMIAPQVGARAYVVFIFDHHPAAEELNETAADIESLVNSRLNDYQNDYASSGSGGPSGKSIN